MAMTLLLEGSRLLRSIQDKEIDKAFRGGSGPLKSKCSDKNTIFNIKSSIAAQK